MERKKLGLIVNPIAGLGGTVGLKGSDAMAEEALARGAVPQAQNRARDTLRELLQLQTNLLVYTGPGDLGETICREFGFTCMVCDAVEGCNTTAEDTRVLVTWLQGEGMDLILFAGGDGTARDICTVADKGSVFLGIPAGVKIHSPVYARSPATAGRLAAMYLKGETTSVTENEVLDIDEAQYRREIIATRLYGYLRVPGEPSYTQCRKCSSGAEEAEVLAAIAEYVADNMEKDTWYLIGAGTTTRAVMQELGLENTLIGVDLVRNFALAAKDVYGSGILNIIGQDPVRLVVTVTGGQGFLFGRGNQQLTPELLRRIGRENILILATKDKILKLRGQPLLVDTGDKELDDCLSGYHQVICGYNETIVCKVSPG